MNSPSNSAATDPEAPSQSKLKLAVLMIPAVYPFITVLLYVIMPLTEGWQIWQRTLLITPIMVFLIAYVVAPFVKTRFGWCVAISYISKKR